MYQLKRKKVSFFPMRTSYVWGELFFVIHRNFSLPMKFHHYDLGTLPAGKVVVVTLVGNAANVKLLNGSNLAKYRSGLSHNYYGGHVRQSPVKLIVPDNDNWHVVVDLGGYTGSVRASVRVV